MRGLTGMALVRRSVVTLALGWLVGGAVVEGFGQMPSSPPDSPPPGYPTGMMPGTPEPAVLDTALAVLEFPDPDLTPLVVHTFQDTVAFGGVFHVVLDYAQPVAALPEVRLASGEEWLPPLPAEKPGFWGRILGRNPNPQPDLSSLPERGDQVRVVHSFRVFRAAPFRLQAGSFLSPVIQVQGLVEGTDEIAGIRSPRRVGWSPLVALGLLLFLFLVLLLARWLWNRGREGMDPADRDLPLPAWLTAAVELQDLVQAGHLNRGDSRPFLDGLAGITRRFVAGRYHIPAQDMTGGEIIAACTALGYRSDPPGVFARLIDVLDRHRYDPDLSGPGWCRDQAVQIFQQISTTRIMPRFTEVPADLLRSGEYAWAGLKRELGPGNGHVRKVVANSPEREA